MNDFRDKTIRTKALQSMELNAEITDLRCELQYKFEWSGDVKSGLSNIYTSMYGDWDIKQEKAIEYIENHHRITDIIKQKHTRENKINELRKYKNVSANVYIEPTIYYKLSYVDGETVWVSEKMKMNENNYYIPLLGYVKYTDSNVYAEVTDENIHITAGEYETVVSKDKEPTEMNDFSTFVLEYLSSPDEWVDAEIESIEEHTDKISIPVSINGNSIDLEFSNPQDNKSDVWDFAAEFGYDDPWNLQKEPAQISFNYPDTSSSYQHNFWNIRKPIRYTKTVETLVGIKSKISNILT
jgi:formylmethanofuran dehydrogenase subunit D